jgi:CAAX prenyl protease-like protein
MQSQAGRDAFYRIAPFALFMAFLAAGHFIESPWLPALRGLAAAALLAAFWRHYRELRPVPGLSQVCPGSDPGLTRVRPGFWFLSIICGFAVFGAWIALDSGWAVAGDVGTGFAPLKADGSIDWMLAGLRLFGLALVVPVMEELFWRSFLLRWIDRRDFLAMDPRQASFTAFALSSALFALEHTQWLAGLIAGLVYSWLYKKTGNLRVPIISHAVTNGTLGLWILATGNWRFW